MKRPFICVAACVAAVVLCVSSRAIAGSESPYTDARVAQEGAWIASGTGGEVREDAGEIWLKATGPQDAPAVRREAVLPSRSPSAVMLRAHVKLDGVARGARSWYSGRLLVTYLDADGGVLGETYTLDRLEGSSDWREVRRQFPVPAGARRVRTELQLLHPREGSIGFRDVSLQVLDATEAQAWRADAEARIREHRMATLRVNVEDAEGRPVPDAEVAVFMRRHAYPFGTAAPAKLLIAPPGDRWNDAYRSVVENFFNYVTLENDLKVKRVESAGIDAALQALGWLRERGIAARGHVLTWPSLEMSSKAENAAKDDPETLRAVMRRTFRARLEPTAPYGIVDWDVLNEPTVHNDLLRILGDEQAAEWFRWAAEGAPKARLYLNENNVEFGGGNREGMEQWIRRLQAAGAPVGGLGWQGHMWHRTLPSGQNILDDLDHFARYGLPIQVTEYDTHERFTDEDDARFIDEFLTAWFSHPSTAGFIMWGFNDANIWNGNAPLFRADWSLKPSGKAWMDAVFGRWWTEARGRSADDGTHAVRGFFGDYEIEATQGGRHATATARLGRGGAEVVLRLESAGDGDAGRRLVSTNPYTTGKLPAIQPRSAKDSGAYEPMIVRVKDGRGAAALSPTGDGRVLKGGERGTERVDLYARFDLAAVGGRNVDTARLRLRVKGAPEKAARVRVQVLSNRFVPQGDEAGLDWAAADLGLGRAPGRDAITGEYRLGDAAVAYLGDVSSAETGEGGEWLFSSSELARAIGQAQGKPVTVILSTTATRLELDAIELELRVKKAGP